MRKLKDIYFTPKCCEEVQVSRAVTLRLDIYSESSDANDVPKWRTSFPGGFEFGSELIEEIGINKYKEISIVKYCPHCGTLLPKVKKKIKIPKNVSVVTDRGYYCDTCKCRLHACKCKSPEFAWEIAK